MSPKKRNKENAGLPKRWRLRHGAYYYRVPPGQEHRWDNKKDFRLGKSYTEALTRYAERVDTIGNVYLMDHLCDKYALEVIPDKKPATQRNNHFSLKRVKTGFRGCEVHLVSSPDCFKFADHVTRTHGPSAANRDIEVLSHMFSYAIRWGIIGNDKHPIRGLRMKNTTKGGQRYVEDWELTEFRKVCGSFLDAYIGLKGVTGYRKSDMLSLKRTEISQEGISRSDRKTGKRKLLPMTVEMRVALDQVYALNPRVSAVYLFSTRKGQPYIKPDGTTSGFDSIWRRRMDKALSETALEKRFTEHDLRRKVGSDMETEERAKELLDHSSLAVTRKSYRAKGKVVTPAKGFKKDA